jgi:outer membrane immunogenic protein
MKGLPIRAIGLLGMLTGGAAVAADLPKPVYKAPPAPMVADPWNGFYVGINGGGSISRNRTSDTTVVPPIPFPVFDFADFSHSPAGAVFGAQGGWNWHALPSLVLGVESDWQWSGQSETVCTYACLPASGAGALLSITDEQSLKWFGTARGRIGWLSQGGSLWYATGGLAWGRVDQNLTLAGTPGFFLGSTTSAASFANDKVGWTIGAGVETPLWSHLSVKAEYLYVDLGSVTNTFASALDPANQLGTTQITTTSSSIRDHIVRLGLNYHFDDGFGTPAASPAMFAKAAPAATTNWNGFYVGGNAGVAIARNPTLDTVLFDAGPFTVAGADSYNHVPLGGLLGVQAGANWRLAPSWLIGAEADGQWSRQTDFACVSQCLPAAFAGTPGAVPGVLMGMTDSQTMKWLATARGRFGWIAPNGSLWYVTGGAAWGRIEDSVGLIASPGVLALGAQSVANFSHSTVGWTVGGGAELPLWARWSVKAEYLYVDLGSVTDSFASGVDVITQAPATSQTTSTSFKIHDHIVRFGLNYHFN